MAANESAGPITPSPDDLRIAAKKFEYAHRASNAGNHDIAIAELRACCKLVPANLSYRQMLRKVAKQKYKNNLSGSSLAAVTNALPKLRQHSASKSGDHLGVLDIGEQILARNPWDRGAILLMAEAAAALDMKVVAVWLLQDGRERDPNDVDLNRALARLLEADGRFGPAMALWELVRQKLPTDREAGSKTKDLAVSDTLTRGKYEESVAGQSDPLTGTRPAYNVGTDSHKAVGSKSTQAPPARPVRDLEGLKAKLLEEPTSVEHHLAIAAILSRQGQLDEARAILQEGLDRTERAPQIRLSLNTLEIEAYRRKLAQTENQLKTYPADERLLKTQGKLQRKISSLELDLARFKVEQDEKDLAARFELGAKLLANGKPEEAIPELQAARGDQRILWKALLHFGHCFAARENWPLAKRNYEEALRLLPESESASRKELLFRLATGSADAGDYPRAVELGIDLADLDYAYRDIGKLLDEWQRRVPKTAGRG